MSQLLYRAYELRLLQQVQRRPRPRHVGIILDGNRRSAQKQGVTDPHAIYALGAKKLDDVLDWCAELGIGTITLWVFSTQNLNRPGAEVSGIMSAVEKKIGALMHDPRIHSQQVHVKAVGRLELLPASTAQVLSAAERATAGYSAMTLTIAVAYGGREEIADAVRGLLRDKLERGTPLERIVEEITPEEIAQHLYTTGLPDPDLIIRTSGEIRLSGFLLWQSAYSEFYFSDVNWPEFRKIDFLRAVRSFQDRQRRFGR